MVEDSARRNILHIKKINAFIKTYRNNIWEVIVIVMTTVKPWHSQQKKINNKKRQFISKILNRGKRTLPVDLFIEQA